MNIYISVVDSEFKYYYYSHIYSRETKVYRCLFTLTKPVGNQADLTLKSSLLSDMFCCFLTITH